MFLHHFHVMTVLYRFHVYPLLPFLFFFGLESGELGSFEPAGLGLWGFELAGLGLWGLELDVSFEGFSFSGGGYSVFGRSTSLGFLIPGNRLSSPFTVLRLRPLILTSS